MVEHSDDWIDGYATGFADQTKADAELQRWKDEAQKLRVALDRAQTDRRGAVEAAREQIKALIVAQSAAGYVETAGWALLLDEIDKLPTPGGQ